MSDSKSAQDNTFEPTHPFNLEDPKSWAEGVGALDWDKTHICFTKRSLLEFLKQNGVSVGVNYKELEKLPKYASFGEFSSKATETAVKDLVEAEVADPHSEDQPQQNTFRPSRKVREPPGGKSTINFAWGEHEEEDALSMAPPKPDGGKEEVLKHTERDSFGFVVGNDGLNRDSPLSDKAEVEKPESLEPSTMWTSSAISFACVLVLVYILIVLRKETSWLTWLPDPQWALLYPAHLIVSVIITYVAYLALMVLQSPPWNSIDYIGDARGTVVTETADPSTGVQLPTTTAAMDVPLGVMNSRLYPARSRRSRAKVAA